MIFRHCLGKQLPPDLRTWLIKASKDGFQWSETACQADFSLDYAYYLMVLAEDGQPLGFIAYHLLFDQADINRIYVEPAVRGQRIAQALFKTLFTQANQRNIESFILEVADNNAPALSVYQRAGFKTIDRRKNYYSSISADALIMTYSTKEESPCDSF